MYPVTTNGMHHAISARQHAFAQAHQLRAEYDQTRTALVAALGSEAEFWTWATTTPRNISHQDFLSLMKVKLAELNGGAE